MLLRQTVYLPGDEPCYFHHFFYGNIAVNLKIAAKESDNYRICIFLLENGISHTQAGARGDYQHNYVLRRELTELSGEELQIEGNSTGSINIEVPIPDCIQNINNAYVVAFVTYAGIPEVQGVKYAQYLNCGTIIDNVGDAFGRLRLLRVRITPSLSIVLISPYQSTNLIGTLIYKYIQ